MKSRKEEEELVFGFVFFFFLPHHFLHFHLGLPLLHFVCLCSVTVGMNMSISGPFMTAFHVVLHLGHFMLVLIKKIFLKLQGPNFGWDQSIKIWCLDYIQSKIFSLNNYVFNAFLKLKVLHEQFLCTFLRRGFCFSVICLNESTNNWIENSVVSSV